MRLDQPNQSQSIFKRLASLLLAAVCLSLAGCHLWYQDMKGYLEYWTGAVSIGNVSWSASPDSQKDSSGVDTISANATVTASAGIINPSQYPLDGGIGSASESRRSVRISGDAGSAALANASVTSSSFTSMAVEIQPLSQVPTPASLALEHKNFTMEFIPTRSDNALSSASTHSLTLRYNTPPRMPLEVMEYGGSLKFLDGTKQWEVVTGSPTIQLNDLIFWAWPSGMTDPTHPDYVVKFEVYEDGVLFDEYTPQECLMSGQTNLQSFVPQDLKSAGYNIYCSLASTGTEITIYAVDSEGVRSLATTSGRAPHAITLDANGGSFAGSDSVTVYRTEGSTLNGGDLDIPTRSGFYLSGWTVGGSPVTFPYTVSEPVTLTAQWSANPSSGEGGGGGTGGDVVVPSTYTVTFNADGGHFDDGTSILTKTVQAGTAVSEPSPPPTRAGWVFTWWKDPATGSPYDFSKPVTSNLTLMANWTQEFYVSPSNGDDTNLGTQDKPLKNLQAAVDKIVAVNDETSSYTILLTGDVDDATTGSYTANNKALVNINPGTKQDGFTYKNLNLTIKSDTDGTTRTVNAGRTATNTGRVLYVRGDATTVTLKDLIVTGGYSDDSGGGIYINNSKVTLDDVTVDSNTSVKEGGGIFLSSLSSLTMTNSTVSNNKSTQNNGGGVYFKGKNFTMKTGSSISGNTATNGGGVCVDSGGSFIMNDGIISDNYAGFNGGGVYVSQNATFIMKGGSIKANEVGAGAANFSGGSGVYVNGGTFTMEDGEITQNNGLKYGGGVCVISGTLSMSGGEISSNTVTGEGGGVYVVAGATLEMTGGVISNNTATGNGGGVNLSGTLTMTGGSISGNTSTMSGKGVYANDAVAINLGDSAVIAADNDIKLGNGKTITITSSLTSAAPVAAISPFNYTIGAQILSAGSGVTLASEVGKFTVVANGSDTYIVGTDATNPASGVLAKGIVVAGADAAVAISVLSGSETYTVRVTGELTEEQIIGTDGIRNELLSLTTSSPDTKVVLDLSGTTITSLPDDAFYSSSGNTILTPTNLVGVVVPSSLQTIGCGTFRSAGLTSVVFIDSDATWKIEGRDGAVVEANFQPSATSTAAAIEYLTGPTSDRNMEMDMTFTNAYKWTKN